MSRRSTHLLALGLVPGTAVAEQTAAWWCTVKDIRTSGGLDCTTHGANGLQAHRWALLGNAVSVHVAAWIGKALMHPHRHKYQGARDRRFIGMSVPPEAEEGKLTQS